MQAVRGLVTDTLGDYVKTLPLPDSFLGWFTLSPGDWLKLMPFLGAVGGVSYLIYKQVKPKNVVNPNIKKDSNKVVDICDIEDITAEKTAYCRCWRSKKWPLCDGSHNKHNECTGDNVGPLVLKKPKAE